MYVSIIITTLTFVFRVFTASKLVYFSKKNYFRKVMIPILLVAVVSMIPPLWIQYHHEAGGTRSILVMLSSVLTFILAVCFIGTNRVEKDFLKSNVLSKIIKRPR